MMMPITNDYVRNNYSALEIGMFLNAETLHPTIVALRTPDVPPELKETQEDALPGETWTLETCSCVTYMRERGHKFPRVNTPADITPNSVPFIGGLVLFTFSGWPHIGEIVSWQIAGEGLLITHRYLSKGSCITTTGFVRWGGIRGTYKP